ncbi:MAG: SDR family oxidoreductase [Bacteroidia bacterium]|nr:SDR family oxidoreductase [Bacteroidia bacterium]
MPSFKNKTVWFVGASAGIGEAMALQMAAQGAKLLLSARREAELNRVAEACRKLGATAEILPLDLTLHDTHPELTQKALQILGHIDHLVLCGGISQRSGVLETEMETYRRLFEVDFFGYVSLTKLVLPDMLARQSGHISVISSVAGKIGTPKRTGYCAAKHALQGFYDALAAEYYNEGIRVSIVTPGYVRTDIGLYALKGDGTQYNKTDGGVADGMDVTVAAKKMVRGIANQKSEILVAQSREKLGVYLKRFFPGILRKVVRKADPVN